MTKAAHVRLPTISLLVLVMSSVRWAVPNTALGQSAGLPTKAQSGPQIGRLDVITTASPSGWMGDGEFDFKYVQVNADWTIAPHSPPSCMRISYAPGPVGWAGIFWLNEPNNWGDKSGTDLSRRGFTKVTFWAKGEIGQERVEFRVGGITSPSQRYRDSLDAKTGFVSLTKEWTQYQIDLSGRDLSNVIGLFGWVAPGLRNPTGLVFYLDDIFYQ
jgi:hypothetical protein